MMLNNIVFTACIDENRKYTSANGQQKMHFYEYEAIRAFNSIRNNLGCLSKCKILCIKPYNIHLSEATISELNRLNVKILELPNYDYADRLFMNTIAAQDYVATIVEKGKNIIYIDLDIEFIHEIPQFFLDMVMNNHILCKYDRINQFQTAEFAYRFNNVIKLGGIPFNTYFNVFPAGSHMFKKVLEISNSDEYIEFFRKNILFNNDDDYFFEEGLFDYAYMTKQMPLDLNIISCSAIEDVFFKHVHMNTKEVLKYAYNKQRI